jgi:hypothetical protein
MVADECRSIDMIIGPRISVWLILPCSCQLASGLPFGAAANPNGHLAARTTDNRSQALGRKPQQATVGTFDA